MAASAECDRVVVSQIKPHVGRGLRFAYLSQAICRPAVMAKRV